MINYNGLVTWYWYFIDNGWHFGRLVNCSTKPPLHSALLYKNQKNHICKMIYHMHAHHPTFFSCYIHSFSPMSDKYDMNVMCHVLSLSTQLLTLELGHILHCHYGSKTGHKVPWLIKTKNKKKNILAGDKFKI